jgi:hypothetical protein
MTNQGELTLSTFSHQELCKESNLSFALLKEIMSEEDLTLNRSTIYLFGIPIEDNSGKILLLYNTDSVKIRRKNKDRYDYFNAFNNKNHLEFLLDKLYEFNDEIDCIEIEEVNPLTDWYSAKLKNINNKVMKEIRVFDTKNFNKQKSIMRLLLTYYNILV